MSNTAMIVYALLVIIGILLYFLYRKKHTPKLKYQEPSTTSTPRPTIPNMKAVSL